MLKRAHLLATALLLLVLAGCASGSSTTPTQSPTFTPLPQRGPQLAFDTLGVDLGPVDQDLKVLQSFLIINRGDSPMTVGPITIEMASGEDIASVPNDVVEMKPGEAFWLPITLGPHQQLGEHKAIVKVPSDDPSWPVALLPVMYQVVEAPPPPEHGPRLRVDKEVVRAGLVPYDWPLYASFTIINDGDEPLVLQDIPQIRVESGC